MSDTFTTTTTVEMLKLYGKVRELNYNAREALDIARDVMKVREARRYLDVHIWWELDHDSCNSPQTDEDKGLFEDGWTPLTCIAVICPCVDHSDGSCEREAKETSLSGVWVEFDGSTDSHRTDTREALYCRNVEAELCRELGVI